MAYRFQLDDIFKGNNEIIDFILSNAEFQEPEWIYELKYLVDEIGYVKALEYIKTSKDPRYLFMNSQLMNEYNLNISLERIDAVRKDVAVEGIFTCKNEKCRSKRTVASSKQTRSADEAATVTIVCKVCETTWKMH
uniref:Transcription factor S-II n=1 Tax=Pithovirus LCPAC401 TaxID=2506595 RepID=A0A481Z9D3_9VIRU|nr:MAG: transcription factor S-II [Pithovirus LCPAC401]